MANERGKSIDNTHLSIDQAEERGFLHRDYIAHCLRWTHVVKFITQGKRYETARILDIGCGVDVPLAKLLYSSRLIVDNYIGVDYNDAHKFKLGAFHTGKFPCHAYGNVDFANDEHVSIQEKPVSDDSYDGLTHLLEVCGDIHDLPNVIVCFEMLEHIEPEHVRRVLTKVLAIMQASKAQGNDPVFFMSTPNYDENVGAAANHVNEMKHTALGVLIESLGFEISENYGTFASQKDVRDLFCADYADGRDIWEALTEYYDSNYMATILAPLYPRQARNCIWMLRPTAKGSIAPLKRYDPSQLASMTPWTSSAQWQDLLPEYVGIPF